MKLAFVRLILLSALCLTLLGASSCDEKSEGTPALGYFRVLWNGDASTQATVAWSALDNPPEQRVYYDEVDYGTDTSQYRNVSDVTSTSNHFNISTSFVRLESLKPKTKYYFVVATSKGNSSRLWFETASDLPTDRLSIIAGGDSRNNRLPRQNANLLVSKLRPHAVMFGGDMVEVGRETIWREWFQDWQLTISSDGRVTPLIIARGNHEDDNSILVDFFDTPPGVFYSTSLNGGLARVYTLNSETSISGNQTNWLKADLSSNTLVYWKLAQYHRPMRAHHRSKSEGDMQYQNWAQPFYDFGMNIVVESDSHTVKTTWPLKPSNASGNDMGFVRDDARGTVYLGEGCWGAPLRKNDDDKTWTRNSGVFNHFNWIFLDRDRAEIRTVKVDNAPQVSSLTDDTRFDVPANLDVWKPSNGEVITINR